MYLLKLALRPWRVAPVSQIISSVSVGFLVFGTVLLFWLSWALTPVIHRLQSEQIATAYLVPTVPIGEEKTIEDSIRTLVGSAEVRTTTAEEFLKVLKEAQPELATELEEMTTTRPQTVQEGSEPRTHEDPFLIPRFVTISGMLDSADLEQIKRLTGIESVESSRGRQKPVVEAFLTLRLVSRAMAVGLLLALLTGMLHLARVHAQFHGAAHSILELWGASSVRSKIPSAFSGILVGTLGGFGASLLILFTAPALKTGLGQFSPMLAGLTPIHPLLAGAALGLGMMVGVFCGFAGVLRAPRRSIG